MVSPRADLPASLCFGMRGSGCSAPSVSMNFSAPWRPYTSDCWKLLIRYSVKFKRIEFVPLCSRKYCPITASSFAASSTKSQGRKAEAVSERHLFRAAYQDVRLGRSLPRESATGQTGRNGAPLLAARPRWRNGLIVRSVDFHSKIRKRDDNLNSGYRSPIFQL